MGGTDRDEQVVEIAIEPTHPGRLCCAMHLSTGPLGKGHEELRDVRPRRDDTVS